MGYPVVAMLNFNRGLAFFGGYFPVFNKGKTGGVDKAVDLFGNVGSKADVLIKDILLGQRVHQKHGKTVEL
jgi:hypothetical protein